MNHLLIAQIEDTLAMVHHYEALGFWPATTIIEQLECCLRRARHETIEPSPLPLCMAALLRQQYTHRESYCVLAHRLRVIETAMEAYDLPAHHYSALCA